MSLRANLMLRGLVASLIVAIGVSELTAAHPYGFTCGVCFLIGWLVRMERMGL